jgi:hypothetical protein
MCVFEIKDHCYEQVSFEHEPDRQGPSKFIVLVVLQRRVQGSKLRLYLFHSLINPGHDVGDCYRSYHLENHKNVQQDPVYVSSISVGSVVAELITLGVCIELVNVLQSED